jgi:hypothetical protein
MDSVARCPTFSTDSAVASVTVGDGRADAVSSSLPGRTKVPSGDHPRLVHTELPRMSPDPGPHCFQKTTVAVFRLQNFPAQRFSTLDLFYRGAGLQSRCQLLWAVCQCHLLQGKNVLPRRRRQLKVISKTFLNPAPKDRHRLHL